MNSQKLPSNIKLGLKELGVDSIDSFTHISHIVSSNAQGAMVISFILFDAKPDEYYEHWYRQRAELDDLDVNLLGKSIQFKGHMYELKGLSPLMSEHPFVLQSETGVYLHAGPEILYKIKQGR